MICNSLSKFALKFQSLTIAFGRFFSLLRQSLVRFSKIIVFKIFIHFKIGNDKFHIISTYKIELNEEVKNSCFEMPNSSSSNFAT